MLPAFPRDAERSGAPLARTAACRGAHRHAGDRVRRGRRRHRRRAHGGSDHHLGRRRHGLAGGTWLGAEKDRAGRVMVGPDLSLPGHPEIFVIGDTAHALGPTASRCPVWRRSPSSRAPMSRACCARGSPASPRRGLSAIATTAPWRRSAGAPPWPTSAGCRLDGTAGLAAVGPRPRLVPDRLSQPVGRDARLAVVLRDFPVGRAPDHRPGSH